MMERPAQYNEKIKALIDNVKRIIVGKRKTIELVVAAMLANGHVLIEDVPGVGKTTLATAFSRYTSNVPFVKSSG